MSSAMPAPVSGVPTSPVWALGALQPGAVTTITLVVRSAPDAAAGLLLFNTAVVTSTTFDPNLANNSSTAQSQVFGLADIAVDKVASTAIVTSGQYITYTITVTNNGPSAAEDVDIKELLPPSVTLQSLATTQGVCVSQICQLGVLTSGAQTVITAVVEGEPWRHAWGSHHQHCGGLHRHAGSEPGEQPGQRGRRSSGRWSIWRC